MSIDYNEHFERTGDPYGTPNPKYNEDMPRFQIIVRGYESEDDPDWQYKLHFIDHKYQDSDGMPIDAVAAGNCWEDAFATAGEWMDRALNTDHCIF